MADEVLFAPVSVPATKRVRCAQIKADNPHGQPPGVTFVYEEVREFGDGEVDYKGIPAIGIAFDPNRLIYLRDPETGAFLGATTTWGQLYVGLYSAALDEYERAKGADSMKDKPATVEQS